MAETISSDAVRQAVLALDERGLVAYPAGGRYAVAADALDEDAILRAFDATHRPPDLTPSVVVGHVEEARHVARVTPVAREFARRFLPGDLILVLPAAATAPEPLVRFDALESGTVAVRVPPEAVARDLARLFGPVTGMRASRHSTSAPAAPRSVADARAALGSAVAVYVDGGEIVSPRSATVVDATGPSAKVIRDGAIPRSDILNSFGAEERADSP